MLFDLLDGRVPHIDLQSLDVNWEAVEYHLGKYLSYVKKPTNNKLWHMFGKLLFDFSPSDCIDEFDSDFVADVVEAVHDESEKHYRRRALTGVQVFYVEAEEFLDRNTWMFERWAEAAVEARLIDSASTLSTVLDELHERLDCDDAESADMELLHELNGLTADLSGFYWWNCMPGYMPTDDAHGPFDTEDAAEDNAVEMNGDDGYTE